MTSQSFESAYPTLYIVSLVYRFGGARTGDLKNAIAQYITFYNYNSGINPNWKGWVGVVYLKIKIRP